MDWASIAQAIVDSSADITTGLVHAGVQAGLKLMVHGVGAEVDDRDRVEAKI